MKTILTRLGAAALFLAVIGLCVWVYFNPVVFILILVGILVFGWILAGLLSLFLPPSPPPAPRESNALLALLLGLAFGWWLGGGPGDDG